MINDKLLQFSAAQALTATAASTDSIDLGSDRDIGIGTPMFVILRSTEAPTGTSPTLAVSVETDDGSGFGSAATTYTHPTIAGASFASGTLVAFPFPRTNERHVRLKYTLAGTSPTFGVDAWLSSEPPPSWQAYPDAI